MLATDDVRDIARVLRGALRLRTEVVQLVEPPLQSGQYMLEVPVPGEGTLTLLAEPAGPARSDGYPLRVRPVTRVQMAELFALIERLDEPSATVPPPPDSSSTYEDDAPEATMIDDATSALAPGLLGYDSMMPPPAPISVNIGGAPLSSVAQGPISQGSPVSRPVPSSRPGGHGANGTGANTTPSVRPSNRPRSNIPTDPRIGRLIAGKYQIEAAIGSGAAATVYRATHAELRRSVAVKVLHAQNQSDAQFVKRFKGEARTACKLEHANVTRIIDFGQESNGELYLVMELIVGRSLEAILATEGPLPQRRVVQIGIQVCRALVFAHDAGVIHRDIKPENVMIVPDKDDDGEACDLVKVCDFGLAKLNDPDGENAELTVVGMLCGSPAYMSPEQTRGDALDVRTDVYALGVTMFEALTGALPHEAFSLAELFMKKATAPARKPSTLVPSVDPVLEDVIMRAMAPDPRNRHPSARELRSELRAVLAQLEDEVPSHRTIVHE